jgi:hypothetical protein
LLPQLSKIRSFLLGVGNQATPRDKNPYQYAKEYTVTFHHLSPY